MSSQLLTQPVSQTAPARVPRWTLALAFLILLALIAKPLWDGHREFQWGEGGDDGIYWVTAKSLATGHGYRLLQLPGAPFQTKYPPLYPLYLSLAWRVNPAFPANFTTVWLLQVAQVPIYLALLLLVLRQLALSWRRIVLISATSLVTFQFALLGNSLFSELLAAIFTLAAIALLEPDRTTTRRIALAGLCAGLAYLARSAALPLFAAVPIFLFLRNRTRQSIPFFATAAPLAVTWHAWVWLHAEHGSGGYLAEYFRILRVTGFWANLEKQVNAISTAAAENVFPGVTNWLAGIPLHHLVLAASIAGGIRLARRRNWPLALIFTALHLAMVACWWFEGVFRLISPVWPFLVAGLAEEANHIIVLSKKPKLRPAILALAALLILRNDRDVTTRISQVMTEARRQREADQAAYAWIAQNATPRDVVLAWKDTVSFLYTGIPASHPLFVERTPQTAAIKALDQSSPALPAPFDEALLLILESDLSESFHGKLDSFRSIVPGAELEYHSPHALIYRFPIR